MLKIIGKNIKNKRLENQLSQDGLAHLAGISQRSINDIELGQRNMTILTLKSIANVLNTTVEELVK